MTTRYDIARRLVAQSGGNPANEGIVRAVAIWVAFESGSHILSNNPWNLRPGSDYSTCNHGSDSRGFTVFCSWQDGVDATAQRLARNDYRGYRPVHNAIAAGSPSGFFAAIVRSKWSSDHYGGGGKLTRAFAAGGSYDGPVSFGSRSGSPSGSQPPGSRGVDAGAIPDAARAAADPGNWVRILALLVGAGLFAFGGMELVKSTDAWDR